jgi:hypothetical protein
MYLACEIHRSTIDPISSTARKKAAAGLAGEEEQGRAEPSVNDEFPSSPDTCFPPGRDHPTSFR